MSTPEPQILTLTVLGSQAAQLGTRSRKMFVGNNGTIGRSEECDWTLSATGMSRVHAMIQFVNGMYFIEDRSTNGVLLNDSPLVKGEPTTLNDGDRLRIDNFDISVRLQQDTETVIQAVPREPAPSPADLPPAGFPPAFAPAAAPSTPSSAPPAPPPAAAPASDDLLDFGLGDFGAPPPRGGSASDSLIPGAPAIPGDSLIPGAVPPPGDASLDPLALLDEPLSNAPSAPAAPPSDWNHSSGLEDHFHPPVTEAQRSADLLPDDWDPMASDEPLGAAPAPAMPPTPPPQQPALGPLPATPAVIPPPAAAEGWPGMPQAAPVLPPVPAPSAVPAAAPVPPSVAVAPGAATATAIPGLDAILHIVVDGVMDVLRARAEIKNTFRLPMTVIQRSENNPLKFALGTEEAIRKILAPPDPAFLTGTAAFDDAFDDIRCHQMAMLAGVRAGFDAVLRHFDPERLERESEGGRHGFGGKGKLWERYHEHYRSLVADPDACFRRLFGDEFARAYEEQLARLKSARRAQRSTPG